jgi:hypothetical protein
VILGSLAAPPDPALDRLLGADTASALRAELSARARRWAGAAAPGCAFEATSLAAAEAALHGHAGPVLFASPDVPGLDERLVAAALDDLAAGCDVVLGAAHDALPYILAVPRLDPELLALAEGSYRDGVLAAFAQRGLVLGLLRHERRLASAADARALAIDPLAPADLAALVRAGLAERGHR